MMTPQEIASTIAGRLSKYRPRHLTDRSSLTELVFAVAGDIRTVQAEFRKILNTASPTLVSTDKAYRHGYFKLPNSSVRISFITEVESKEPLKLK